jgi:hypothetical protein
VDRAFLLGDQLACLLGKLDSWEQGQSAPSCYRVLRPDGPETHRVIIRFGRRGEALWFLIGCSGTYDGGEWSLVVSGADPTRCRGSGRKERRRGTTPGDGFVNVTRLAQPSRLCDRRRTH